MATFVCGTGKWGNVTLPGDPDMNSVLTATPAFGGINVQWTYPATNANALAHTILYRSTNADFATAVQHKIATGDFFYDQIDNDTITTYYYWIKFVSVQGTVGDLIGPASANARPLIEDMLEQLTAKIDAGVLAQSLKEEIARINVIETLLNTEVGNRLLSIQSLGDTFTALEVDTLGTLDEFNDRINALLDADALFVDELNNISTTLSDADDRITTVRAELAAEDLRLDEKADAIEDALNAAQQVLELRDQELTDALADNVNNFTEQREIYETETSITASSIEGILTRIGENEVAVGSLTRIQNEADYLEAIQFDYIKAETANRSAAFRTQQLVRVTAEEALAQLIEEQVTRVDDNVAEISSLSTTFSNSTSALASRISELSAKLDSAPTFVSGWEAGVDYDQWSSTYGHAISAQTGDFIAGSQSAKMRSSATSPTSSGTMQGVVATIPTGTTTSFSGYELTISIYAKQDPDTPSTGFAMGYSAVDDGSSGWYYFTPTDTWEQFSFTYTVPESDEANHYVSIWADTAGGNQAILVDSLTVRQSASDVTDVSAAIEAEQLARVTADEALASDYLSLESRLDSAVASIQTEASTRSTETEALAQQIESLNADLDDASASLNSLSSTQATQNSAIVSRASSLESRVGNAEANITSVENTTSTLEESIATATSQLQSQIDDNSSSITNEASTRSTALSNAVSLITALRGEYDDTETLVANHSTLIQDNTESVAQNVTAIQAARDSAEALVAAEESARVTAVSAQGTRTDQITTRVGSAETNIASLTTGLSDTDQALSTYQSTVSSQFDDLQTTINSEVSALTTADEALGSRIDALSVDADGNIAGIYEEAQVRATADSVLTSITEQLAVKYEEAQAAIVNTNRIIAEKEFIEAIQYSAIEVNKAAATAGIQVETQIRVEENSAFAQQLTTIGAEVDENMATILQDYTTEADLTSAVATLGTAVYSRVDAADAAIISEKTTRTTLFNTLTDDIAEEAGIRVGAISAINSSISSETSARNSAITTVTNKVTAESNARKSAVTSVENSVSSEASTRASAINSVNSAIDSVEGSISKEISDRSSAVSGLNNLLSSAVSDLEDADSDLDDKINSETTSRQQAFATVANQIDLVAATAADATAAVQTEIQAQLVGTSLIADGSFLAGDGSLWNVTNYLTYRERDGDSSDSLYNGAPAANFALFGANMNYGSTMHNTNQYFYIQPGEEYGISFWFARFNNADGDLKLSLQMYKADGSSAGWVTLKSVDLGDYSDREWNFSGNISYTIPTGAIRGRIIMTMSSNNTKGGAAFTAVKAGSISSALSEKIDSVQTSFGDNLSAFEQSVTTEINTTNGVLTSIGALYTAKVQTNGLIGGFGIYNDGTEVQAGFDVDTFWIGRTNDDKIKPFIVSGGEVFINEAVINKLTFSKLTDESGSFIVSNGKVKADYIDAGDLNVAGAAKFTGDVQSSNFVSEQSGWRIKQNGEIQINSNSNDGRVVQDVDGIRVYDGNGTLRVKLGKL